MTSIANLSQDLTSLGWRERYSEYNNSLKYIESLENAHSQIYMLIFAISVIITNFIVVVSSGLLFKEGCEPRCTYLLLGNISLADMTTGFVVIFGWFKIESIVKQCTLHLSVYIMGAITSSLSVGLIAIDRYIYIMHGIKYKQIIYPQRVRYMLWGTWIVAIMGGAVPFVLFGKEAPECWVTLVAPPSVILVTTVIGLIPLACVLVFYSIILHRAITNVINLKRAITSSSTNAEGSTEGLRINYGGLNHLNTISEMVQEIEVKTTSTNNEDSTIVNRKTRRKPKTSKGSYATNSPNKWKAIKVVIFTTGTHSIIWLPYFITSCIYVTCDKENTPKECENFLINVTSPLAMTTFISTFTNPVIYAWWHKRFREGVKNIYNKHKRLYRLRTNDIRLTTRKNEPKEESSRL